MKTHARLVLGWALAALAASGCARTTMVRQLEPLPFSVILETLDDPSEASANSITPAVLETPDRLSRDLASDMEAAGVFTRCLEPRSPGADLHVAVSLRGGDFGRGRILVPGAIFSTVAWLFAGPASWWIDNRVYDQSRVELNIVFTIPPAPVDEEPGPVSRKILVSRPLAALELNFFERARLLNWILNIFIPPWLDGGDRLTRGVSLGNRAMDFLASDAESIRADFVAAYFHDLGYFLIHDSHESEIVVVVNRTASLERLTIQTPGEEARSWTRETLLNVQSEGEVSASLRARLPGLEDAIIDTHYVIPLHDSGTQNLRVSAVLSNGGVMTSSSWTIYGTGALPPGTAAQGNGE